MSYPHRPFNPSIERFRHRTYETLRSADLNGQEATQESLRAWHNRALHGTYGVVFGLDVGLDGDVPSAGALRALVRPGLAYDATGLDLLLREPVSSPIPFDPEGMTLYLSRVRPEPVLVWSPTAQPNIALGVPVARTVDTTTQANIVLTADPALEPKVTYDAAKKVLTIRGILSRPQYERLKSLAKEPSVIDALVLRWPFEAPRQLGAIGLVVSIAAAEDTDGTLWRADVAPGSVGNSLGQVLTLTAETRLPLKSRAEDRLLVIRPEGEQPVLDLTSIDRLPAAQSQGAVLLARIAPPGNTEPVITLASPIRENITELKDLLTALRDGHKIKYDSGPKEITITGFLTRDEADQVINLVADDPVNVVEVHKRLRTDLDENKPFVPPAVASTERAPLFPPRSRPLARPRTADGSSLPGRTEWKPVKLEIFQDLKAYEATVIIESAGFTEIPQLFAWVERVRTGSGPGPARGAVPSPLPFVGGVEGRPDSRRFIFRIWSAMPLKAPTPLPAGLDEEHAAEWLRENLYVRWLAFQSDPLSDWRFWPGTGTD